jgi:hypothetical protein
MKDIGESLIKLEINSIKDATRQQYLDCSGYLDTICEMILLCMYLQCNFDGSYYALATSQNAFGVFLYNIKKKAISMLREYGYDMSHLLR